MVSTVGTLVLGGVSISEVRRSRIDAIDRTLHAVATQVLVNPRDPVAAAVLAVDQSPSAVALGFGAPGTSFTWLRELPGRTVPMPSDAERVAALVAPIDMQDGYRLSAVHLRDGANLFVVASMDQINEQTRFDEIFLATFWLVLSLFMGLVIRILVRRDVREIEQLVSLASRIADGADAIDIPAGARATEVGELAAALRAMVDSLRNAVVVEQKANQRMQEFLGDASHELRTPLTVIKGYLELLERDVDAEQRERAMLRMRTESSRMELLINDLLFLAEIGTPTQDRLDTIELTGMVRTLVDDLRELQPLRPVHAELEEHVRTRGVPAHIHRAIGNAMANIRRHTSATDAVNISLRVRGASAHLTIEDAGPGLSEEMYAQGIAHFQRFDRSRSRGTGGSGLGMSIISAVMQEAAGDVEIGKSDLGGLRLSFTFPLARRH